MAGGCVIFDIDGTLANLRHRLHFVSGGRKDWPAFFAGMAHDVVFPDVARLFEIIHAENPVLIVSGRPDDYRDVTEAWLRDEAGLTWDALYMRPAGDTRPDHTVKREILRQIRADGWEPWLVIDDRPAVVAMWRDEGLTCLQAAYDADAGGDARLAGRELLTLMVGPSGAGKSTLAAARFPARQIMSSDDIREDMLGNRYDQTANERVFDALHAVVSARLKRGLPTVIDATNLRRKDRLACAALAPAGTIVRYIVVNRPMAAKLETRGWRSEELLQKHDQTFRSQVKEIMAGDGMAHVVVEDCQS